MSWCKCNHSISIYVAVKLCIKVESAREVVERGKENKRQKVAEVWSFSPVASLALLFWALFPKAVSVSLLVPHHQYFPSLSQSTYIFISVSSASRASVNHIQTCSVHSHPKSLPTWFRLPFPFHSLMAKTAFKGCIFEGEKSRILVVTFTEEI